MMIKFPLNHNKHRPAGVLNSAHFNLRIGQLRTRSPLLCSHRALPGSRARKAKRFRDDQKNGEFMGISWWFLWEFHGDFYGKKMWWFPWWKTCNQPGDGLPKIHGDFSWFLAAIHWGFMVICWEFQWWFVTPFRSSKVATGAIAAPFFAGKSS